MVIGKESAQRGGAGNQPYVCFFNFKTSTLSLLPPYFFINSEVKQ
jgi:hypothetical protein